MVQLVSRFWQADLCSLLADCRERLLLASPYIKHDAAEWLLETVGDPQSIDTTVLTDISVASALGGSLDLSALLLFSDSFGHAAIFDVDRLHAKVYAADESRAIVTSGNLTPPGLEANYEYGVLIGEPALVKDVWRDMRDYALAGREVTRAELAELERTSRERVSAFRRAEARLSAEARRDVVRDWNEIADAFGAAPGSHELGSARFKPLIVQVLTSRGWLTTPDLCDAIQASWPYLCDDKLMRVARDGTRKRQWRHDVHTAQETLQRAGVLRRDATGRWHVERSRGYGDE